jgi:hypothetical protein
METKKKTRQKPAFIKIAVDDEFIDKLHGTMFAGLNDKLPMTCLSLCWDEPQKESKEGVNEKTNR